MQLITILMVIVLIGIAAYLIVRYDKKMKIKESNNTTNQENTVKDMENNEENNLPNTKQLFLSLLTKIGCQPEEDEDGRVGFCYQGQNFVAFTNDETLFIVLYYPYWHETELYDIDEFTRLKKVINIANSKFIANTWYDINEAGNTIDVCSKNQFILHKELPKIEEYLKHIMTDFFETRIFIETELEKERKLEEINN